MTFPQAPCDGQCIMVLFQEQMAEQAARFWVSPLPPLPFPARRDVSHSGFMHHFSSIILHWKGKMYDFGFSGPHVEDNSPPHFPPCYVMGVEEMVHDPSNLNAQVCFPECTSWHSRTVRTLCPWPLLHANYKSFPFISWRSRDFKQCCPFEPSRSGVYLSAEV